MDSQSVAKAVSTFRQCWAILIFGNRYDISNLKPIFSIYLFRRVLCFRGTHEKILTFLELIWYKINKITFNQDSIMPFQTDIGRYCSQYRYSDISIFFFGALQNRYGNFFRKTDTIYWFIAQHYLPVTSTEGIPKYVCAFTLHLSKKFGLHANLRLMELELDI